MDSGKFILLNKENMFLIYSLIGVIIIGALSLVSAFILLIKDSIFKKLMIYFVGFSAGALMGGAFFHLIPEALEKQNSLIVFVSMIVGFCIFFILEKVLRWRHCHDEHCLTHEHLGWINLFGDALHNLIDGMIVFASFAVSPALGVVIVISIILHEIPQEIGTFAVLIYSGFSKTKAIVYNILSAVTAIIGVLLAYSFSLMGTSIDSYLLPFAAGGFLYISASDLIPELHKDRNVVKSTISFIVFILAIFFMILVKVYFEK